MKEAGRRFLVLFALLLAAAAAWAQSEDLRLTVGKSIVLDYPTEIARISTSNPEVADAVAVTVREVLVHAKAQGAATLVVWAKSGERSFYNINVELNLEPVRKLLQETFPEEDIRVQAARDSVSLTGRVSSKEVAERAAALMAGVAKSVVNNLRVAPPPVDKQILLRVKFAELNRSAASALGANLVSTGALNTIGSTTTGQFPSPRATELRGGIPGRATGATSEFTISDVLNVFAFRPELNLAAFVKALQSQGLVQILAEPNLVTTNGKEASFLVGGEFPVPVLQGGANAGAVTVQFREFGIRLTFLPQVTEHNTIKMFTRPEVSSIDMANAVSLGGFLIPALATRRMETNVELEMGQSFVIAGLIDDRVTENLSKIPGLAHIPVLGALFRSRQENKTKSELIVMVTPEVAHALSPAEAKPVPVMPKEFLPPATSTQASPSAGKGVQEAARQEVAPAKAKAKN